MHNCSATTDSWYPSQTLIVGVEIHVGTGQLEKYMEY